MAKVILFEKQIGDINIKYSISKAEPCLLNALIINDYPTSMFTFGKIRDVMASSAPPDYFGCMKRLFIPYAVISSEDLKLMKITKEDVPVINEFISAIANKGKCDFCEKKLSK